MTTPSNAPRGLRGTPTALAVTALALAALFHRSFLPGQLAFANDAPFGLMDAFSELRWSHFWRGSWLPLNWVGGEALPLQADFTHLLFLLGGTVAFNKFIAPLSMLLLAVGAFVFSRRHGFATPVAALVALAAGLNSNYFSHACWGLGGRATLAGFSLLAMAAVAGRDAGVGQWLRLIPAGLCVGLAVVEGADGGAILSVYVAAYIVFRELARGGGLAGPALRGVLKTLVVVACSAWVAFFAVQSLVGTQIRGVAGAEQDAKSREQRWEFATGWSYPPAEVTRFAVPGIQGYRMDTPGGGNYWGAVGADGSPPRFSGGGEYAGVLVLLVAAWAVARAARGGMGQPFDAAERRMIGFWAAMSLASMLLAFGHYAPFYRLVYALPYFSTIRIPMKFLHPMHLGLIVLFGYGLEGLRRSHLAAKTPGPAGLTARLAAWWRGAKGFERHWRTALVALPVAGLAATFLYDQARPSLTRALARTPGIDPAEAPEIAAFSAGECWTAAILLAVYAAILAVVASGWCGGRARTAFLALGAVLLADLYRANIPWVQHYDYERRYQSNAVIDLLRTNAWEGRMTARLSPRMRVTFSGPRDGTFGAVHNQWLEHQFQFYRVQTLDIIQMSRVPRLDEEFLRVFEPANVLAPQMLAYGLEMDRLPPDQASQVRGMLASAGPTNFPAIRRLWELTNTRWIVGASGAAALLNEHFDPAQRRFRSALDFGLALKPDTARGKGPGLDDITAVPQPGGPYSVVEFSGALPRAKLFTRWRTETNTAAALAILADPRFDPHAELLLSEPAAAPSSEPDTVATAAIESWLPRDVVVRTRSAGPGHLLLVQRWHPDWRVLVDGKPAPLLRANHLFAAVAVPAGEHAVEFHYDPPRGSLYVTLSALAAGALALFCVGRLAPPAD